MATKKGRPQKNNNNILINDINVEYLSTKTDKYDNSIVYLKLTDPKNKLKQIIDFQANDNDIRLPIWTTETQDVILKVNTGAEAIEGIVHANEFTSPLFGKPIKEIPLPEGTAIAAIIRHGELIMPSSSVELTLNDHLVIFLSDKNNIDEVEVLFK